MTIWFFFLTLTLTRDIMFKRSEVRGVHLNATTPQENIEIFSKLSLALAEEKLKVFVNKTYALADAPQAHVDIMSPHGAAGKLIIHPWE